MPDFRACILKVVNKTKEKMMEAYIETIKVLEAKGWLNEFKPELNEIVNNNNKVQQEELLNILKSDNLTIEQIKKLFIESIHTGGLYKISKVLK